MKARQGVGMEFEKKKSNEIAQKFLGMSFELGGRGPDKIDCFGILVIYYKEFGIEMPDFTRLDDWGDKEDYYLNRHAIISKRLPSDEKPQCGDFILFKNMKDVSNHAGVYLGDNRFVHAYKKVGVKIDSLTQAPWKEKVSGYYRIKDD